MAVFSGDDNVNDSNDPIAWAMPFRPGSGWGEPTPLETGANDASQALSVALDDTGRAVAAWQRGTPAALFVNRFDGTSWGSRGPVPVPTPTTDAAEPTLGVDARGNATVVWVQALLRTAPPLTFANVQDATGTWGAPVVIGGRSSGGVDVPDLAVNASSQAVAVWGHGIGALQIAGNVRAADGTWSTASVFPTTSTDAQKAEVAINASGAAVTAWQQFDKTTQQFEIAASVKP